MAEQSLIPGWLVISKLHLQVRHFHPVKNALYGFAVHPQVGSRSIIQRQQSVTQTPVFPLKGVLCPDYVFLTQWFQVTPVLRTSRHKRLITGSILLVQSRIFRSNKSLNIALKVCRKTVSRALRAFLGKALKATNNHAFGIFAPWGPVQNLFYLEIFPGKRLVDLYVGADIWKIYFLQTRAS
jgi:hypothetical protein